jgi:hypothetical protein
VWWYAYFSFFALHTTTYKEEESSILMLSVLSWILAIIYFNQAVGSLVWSNFLCQTFQRRIILLLDYVSLENWLKLGVLRSLQSNCKVTTISMRLIVLKILSRYRDSEKVYAHCICRSETKGELESFQNWNLTKVFTKARSLLSIICKRTFTCILYVECTL